MKTRYTYLFDLDSIRISSECGLLLCFSFCFVINEKNLKSCAEGKRNRKPRVSVTRPHHLELTETQGLEE
jgi:hypothetical protein